MSENLRLNIGCGRHPLIEFTNIDSAADMPADFCATVPPLPYGDESVNEIFAGHYLEHLTQIEASAFLGECYRCLKTGAKLGLVVPDTREVMRRFLDPTSYARIEFPTSVWHDLHDLDEVCALFLYSTAQDSHHQWSYDLTSLRRLLERHGFKVTGEINRWLDPRISVGGWYQCGLDAVKE